MTFTFVLAGLATWAFVQWFSVKPEAPVTRLEMTLPAGLKLGEFSRVSGPAANAWPTSLEKQTVLQSSISGPWTISTQRYSRARMELQVPFFSPAWPLDRILHQQQIEHKVSVDGGAPVTICDVSMSGDAGQAGAETTRSCSPPEPSPTLLRVSAEGGEPERLTRLDTRKGEVLHGLPWILPHGRGVLFTVVTGEGSSVAVLSPETGESKVLIAGGSSARYLPTGHLLYFHSGGLQAVPFDLTRLELSGPSFPVIDGISSSNRGGLDISSYAVSDSGALVYVPHTTDSRPRELVWVDRQGEATPLPVRRLVRALYPRLSPDGQRLAFSSPLGVEDP